MVMMERPVARVPINQAFVEDSLPDNLLGCLFPDKEATFWTHFWCH